MNYSICLLDKGGRTQATRFGPFDDDVAAVAQARSQLAGSAIVEVWRDNHLVVRLYRDPPASERTRLASGELRETDRLIGS